MRNFLLFLWLGLAVQSGGWLRAEPPELRVGMELSYPPFEMTDPLGEPAGVSVDLARALAEALGRPLRIENMPFDGLIPALRTGKIDLVISSLTATEERGKAIDFSRPYLRTGLCFLTGPESKVETIEELNAPGRRVAVKKGTTGHLYALANLGRAEILVLDREQACVLEVTQGKADAFIYDQMSILKNWQQNAKSTRAVLRPFREEAWAVGLRKGNDVLKEQVNGFLERYLREGGFEKLADKHLQKQKAAFAELGYPFFWTAPGEP